MLCIPLVRKEPASDSLIFQESEVTPKVTHVRIDSLSVSFFTKPISLWKNKENNTLVLSTISCTYYIMIKMLLQGQRD